MNILVVDNKTSYLLELKKLLKPKKIISWDQLPNDFRGFDLVVLSGGHQLSVNWHLQAYGQEISLIKKIKIPIIGICLGSELIARAFGAKLHLLNHRDQGVRRIEDVTTGKIYRVFESHRWAITKIPKSLIPLAKSKDGVEIFKHRTRQIFGLQFHPEMFVNKTDGRKIFSELLKTLSSPKN